MVERPVARADARQTNKYLVRVEARQLEALAMVELSAEAASDALGRPTYSGAGICWLP